MANKFEQLIEYIVNSEEQKAQELFHEIVVEKSREIYESIIDEETPDLEEAVEEVEEEEAVEESIYTDEADDLIADIEADEFAEDEDEMDMGDEMPMDMGDEEGEEEEEEEEEIEDRVDDLESALDELKAEFDKLMGMEEEPEMEEGIVREYEEKAPAAVTSEKSDSTTSPVAKDGGSDPDADAGDSMSHGSDESGRPAPAAQSMNATTEPDMKKV